MSFPISQIKPLDSEISEEWTREVAGGDSGVHGVGAYLAGGIWRVSVSAMELVREEPLESELRDRIQIALEGVAGVDDVEEEDREVWLVGGKPSGEALVAAVGGVLDSLAARIRAHIDAL